MLVEINQVFCTCQKCGHTFTVRPKKEEAGDTVFIHAITIVSITKNVRKCPACHVLRWDIVEDGRSVDRVKLEVDKTIDL